MDAPPTHPSRGSLSRQRLGHLQSELHRIETYLDGISPLRDRDPTAILATVASDVTRLRQITAGYLGSNDRDA